MFFINHTDIGEGSAVIIEVDGPLNSETAPDFDDYILKLSERNVIHLLLDMKNINFISSEGIGAALMIQRSINQKNGLAVFFNLNYEIKSLFKLLGFDKIFTIAADRAEALEILDRHIELFQDGTTSSGSYEDKIIEKSSAVEEFNDPEFELSEPGEFEMIEDADNAAESFIIECVKCRSFIRIKEAGDQLCPYCSAEFTVNDKKQAVFKIKG